MTPRKHGLPRLAQPEFVPDSDEDGLWDPPDPMLMDAGAGGELLVAQVRLVLILAVTMIPIVNLITAPYLIETYVGLAASTVALIFALIVWGVVRHGFYRPWLGL